MDKTWRDAHEYYKIQRARERERERKKERKKEGEGKDTTYVRVCMKQFKVYKVTKLSESFLVDMM